MASEQIVEAMKLIATTLDEGRKQHREEMQHLLETSDRTITKNESRKRELRLDFKQPFDTLKGTSEETKTKRAGWSEKVEAHIAAKATKGLEMFEWIKKQKGIIDEDKRDEFTQEEIQKEYVNI